MTAQAFDAVVLAGGRARRLGGVSKPEVTVGGRALVDHVLDAAAGARQVVLVAPDRLVRAGVVTVLEDPPDGGPAAGLVAGLAALPPEGGELVLVLACDMPLARRVVPALLAAARDGRASDPGDEAGPADAPGGAGLALQAAPLDRVDGARLVDADGHRQHLVAVYRRAALDAAVARHGGPAGVRGLPVRALLDGLHLVDVPDSDGGGADADTWDDVRRIDDELASDGPVAGSDPSDDGRDESTRSHP